jgi:TetR/AcrR family transcriptional regulator, regulator of autoinduction and epiphytic fitness
MEPTKTKSVERLSPQKAEAILAGAMQEFLAHGYAATSMDKVAAAAGVSKATVYNHFRDKEGLFNALNQQLVEKKFRAVLGPPDAPALHGDPRIVLRQLATNVLDAGMRDQQFHSFMRLIVGESGRFPELARTFVRNIDLSAFHVLRQYFTNHAEALKLQDPEATARIFIGSLVHYIIVQEMLYGADIMPLERERLVDSLVYLITRQNLSPSPSPQAERGT